MIIRKKGQFGNVVLLAETYTEFRQILKEQGNNVMYAGVETINFKEYYRITLKDRF